MEEHTNYWLRRRISRRGTLVGGAIAGVGAASMALVGCGDDDNGGSSSTGTPKGLLPTVGATPTPQKQPKPGGAFSFQMPAIPPSLDPYTQTSFQNAYVNGLVYSKLIRFKAGTPEVAPADNTMEPDLAAKMPEQPDELTYVFNLKQNVKWQNVAPTNGRAFTSDDVKYAFDRYMNYEKSVHKSNLQFIDKIETPDANTVKLTTKAPYADAVFYLGGNLGVWISPKEHAESQQATAIAMMPPPIARAVPQASRSPAASRAPIRLPARALAPINAINAIAARVRSHSPSAPPRPSPASAAPRPAPRHR